jgi:CheY-like chemotaxis protein
LDVTNMKVVRHIEAGAPPIMGDEHQLEQVFLNILMNAEQFTYTANGGGTLTVSISHEGGLVKVSFKDDGPGIAKDDLPKIFDPFFTTKDVGKGTGLGLSICYGIVHEHNGVIRVDSAPGEGSEFVIEFPAARPEALAGATIQRMPSSVGHAPPRNLDVLIVEDEDAVAEVFARALSEDGHHVIVECDSSKALSVKDFQKYNVVVLDLKMPGVNGMTLFDHLAKQGPEIASRVLFVTGDALDPVAREFIDRTGNPLLVKPFSIGELVESVKSLSMKLASRTAAASPEGAAKAKS